MHENEAEAEAKIIVVYVVRWVVTHSIQPAKTRSTYTPKEKEVNVGGRDKKYRNG